MIKRRGSRKNRRSNTGDNKTRSRRGNEGDKKEI
jgi:hypothetical protein